MQLPNFFINHEINSLTVEFMIESQSLFRMESKSGSSRHKLQNQIQWKVWVAVFLIAQ